jgi:hypothetical protein
MQASTTRRQGGASSSRRGGATASRRSESRETAQRGYRIARKAALWNEAPARRAPALSWARTSSASCDSVRVSSPPTTSGWSILSVATLPYPCDLFRCPRRDEYLALTRDPESQAVLASAFQSFAADGSKSPSCKYHRPDWTKAAEVACSLVELGHAGDMHEFESACKKAALDDCTAWAACSFFDEPISISGHTLGNGQHRVCAMKTQGVARCPIED